MLAGCYKNSNSQRGIAPIFLILVLLLAIGLVVWLIRKPTGIIPHAQELSINQPTEPQFVGNEILVKFKADTGAKIRAAEQSGLMNIQDISSSDVKISEIQKFARANNIQQITPVISQKTSEFSKSGLTNSDIYRWYIVKLEGGSENISLDTAEYFNLNALAQEAKSLNGIETAELNGVVFALFTPNDTFYPQQWFIPKIGVDKVWDTTEELFDGSSDIKVAILDTGIENTHPDLQNKIVGEADFTGSTNGTKDYHGHGTHVAGIVSATLNNSQGVAGIASGVSLMNVKVLGDSGAGSGTTVSSGLVWASDNGASIINMSLGAAIDCTRVFQDGIDYAWGKGAAIFAAAGNDNRLDIHTPGKCQHIIPVASTDETDTKSHFSNYSPDIPIAAPGSYIYSTYVNSSYKPISGTSMATPVVSAVAALIKSANPSLSNQAINLIIENTADKIAKTGTYWKYGRVNAEAAVKQVLNPSVRLTAKGECFKGSPVINLDFNDIAPGGSSDLSVQYSIETTPNVFKNTLIPGKLSLRPLYITPNIANLEAGNTYQVKIKATTGITSNTVSVTIPQGCSSSPSSLPLSVSNSPAPSTAPNSGADIPPKGYIAQPVCTGSGQIFGWVCDGSNYDLQTDVHIYVDGKFYTSVKASETRSGDTGVSAVCGNNGAHWFSAPLPEKAKNRSVNITAFGINLDSSGNIVGSENTQLSRTDTSTLGGWQVNCSL